MSICALFTPMSPPPSFFERPHCCSTSEVPRCLKHGTLVAACGEEEIKQLAPSTERLLMPSFGPETDRHWESRKDFKTVNRSVIQ